MRFSSRVVSRRAFTLVELLSVIGIMDFLGPLLTVTSNEYPEATPVSRDELRAESILSNRSSTPDQGGEWKREKFSTETISFANDFRLTLLKGYCINSTDLASPE